MSTCSDEGVEGDSVWEAALIVHLIEELQSQLPLSSLFAGRDEAAVCDDAALTPLVHHFLEHLHDLLREATSMLLGF